MTPLRFNRYGVLPPGIHRMAWEEMDRFLAFTQQRRRLIDDGLKPFLRSLRGFPIDDIYIDGSFVTGKPAPGDIDGYVSLGSAMPSANILNGRATNSRKRFGSTSILR